MFGRCDSMPLDLKLKYLLWVAVDNWPKKTLRWNYWLSSCRPLTIYFHNIYFVQTQNGFPFITLNHSFKQMFRSHTFGKRETSRVTWEKTLFAAPDSDYVVNPASTSLLGVASVKRANNRGQWKGNITNNLQHNLQHPINLRETILVQSWIERCKQCRTLWKQHQDGDHQNNTCEILKWLTKSLVVVSLIAFLLLMSRTPWQSVKSWNLWSLCLFPILYTADDDQTIKKYPEYLKL